LRTFVGNFLSFPNHITNPIRAIHPFSQVIRGLAEAEKIVLDYLNAVGRGFKILSGPLKIVLFMVINNGG